MYTKPKTQTEPSSTGCKTKTTNPDFNTVDVPDCSPGMLDRAEWKSEIQLKEQAASFRTNSNNSTFAQHLLYNGHAISPVEDAQEVT